MTQTTALRRDEADHNVTTEFAAAVVRGLSQAQKSLPCRYFYDERGSELFEQITFLPEYYPTRVEIELLRQHAHEIAATAAKNAVLVELGSGSSRKTELLLAALPNLKTYVAIDVSASALQEARIRLTECFPGLDVRPICADFAYPINFPPDLAELPKIGFFPGSTIGNLKPHDAVQLLIALKRSLSPCSRIIVGVDLTKDARTLVRAYNDSKGVTAAFNLNVLARINREIEPVFNLRNFNHEAIYDPREGRIEMHLVSLCEHEVKLLGHRFHFHAGETIHTENSYKYSVDDFHGMALQAGWVPTKTWTDDEQLFSLHDLSDA